MAIVRRRIAFGEHSPYAVGASVTIVMILLVWVGVGTHGVGARVKVGGGAEPAKKEVKVARSTHKQTFFWMGATRVGHNGWIWPSALEAGNSVTIPLSVQPGQSNDSAAR